MIDGRVDYRFTEPIDFFLTSLFSPGASVAAIGLRKGSCRRNTKLVFVLLIFIFKHV
ncbi:hypothetical protein Scep_010147 [Stephania cephalantha]|uniref:Uncharacterized protein n=1 Tax=Stephania cephalantha TaxID=152367 RepID=A0AAP0JUG8_9MAGN